MLFVPFLWYTNPLARVPDILISFGTHTSGDSAHTIPAPLAIRSTVSTCFSRNDPHVITVGGASGTFYSSHLLLVSIVLFLWQRRIFSPERSSNQDGPYEASQDGRTKLGAGKLGTLAPHLELKGSPSRLPCELMSRN